MKKVLKTIFLILIITNLVFSINAISADEINNGIENESVLFVSDDFDYEIIKHKYPMEAEKDILVIKGFSETGAEKFKTNKILNIPEEVNFNGKSAQLEGIGPEAFSNKKIEGVVFPEFKKNIRFVIGRNAFSNNDINYAEFKNGIHTIGPEAFMHNNLEEIYFPETLWATGNNSFSYNQLNKIEFSDFIQNLQIDNYSFAHNRLIEVNLPYSIFKFRDYVFYANTGNENIEDAPDKSGVVYLYTVNQDHLTTETYIAKSKYHKIINIAPNIKRDELFDNIIYARKIIGYVESKEFELILEDAKKIFVDAKSTQKEIDEINKKLIEEISKYRHVIGNKTRLLELIEYAENLDLTLFEENSVQELKEVIEKIKSDLDNIPDDEIDFWIDELQLRIDNLVILDNYIFKTEDFIFDDNIVIGFSDSGKEKVKKNKNLIIPSYTDDNKKVEIIGKNAFKTTDGVIFGTDVVESPNGIKSVELPNSIKKIEDFAFQTNQLTKINLPETLEYIGASAFNGNRLEEIVIPESVSYIGDGAFSLNQLTYVKLPTKLKEINKGVFSRNIKLESIVFPENLEVIKNSAFMGVPFKNLIFPKTLTKIEDRAFNGHRLSVLNIPSHIIEIGKQSFAQNVKFRTLKEVYFEDGIKIIGSNAFKSGLLQSVNLPATLEKLAPDAFKNNLDKDKEEVIVKLYTDREDYIEKFENKSSIKNQKIILTQFINKLTEIKLKDYIVNISSENEIEEPYSYLDNNDENIRIVIWKNKPDFTRGDESSATIRVIFVDNSFVDLDINFIIKRITTPYWPENTIENDSGLWNNEQQIIKPQPEKKEEPKQEENKEDPKQEEIKLNRWAKYMQGNEKGEFMPEKALTRAEAAQIIYNMLKEDKNPDQPGKTYTDVKENAWYKKAVDLTSAKGIFEGNEFGEFMPEKELTKAEWIAVLARLRKLQTQDTTENWYTKYIDAANKENWLDIYNEQTNYEDKITREEVAHITNRALGRTTDAKYVSEKALNKYTDINETRWSYLDIINASTSYYFEGNTGETMTQ